MQSVVDLNDQNKNNDTKKYFDSLDVVCVCVCVVFVYVQ